MEWSSACPGWEERVIKGESLIPFPPLFPDEADEALNIFKSLKLVDVLDRPTLGEAGRAWLFDFVSAIFGSYDAENGRRLIQEYFLLISKKNSKALALNTPIPTPDGWSKIEDIHPGSIIFGSDGKPCKVFAESEIFTDHECYQIEFSNGESVIADAGHLWFTSALADDPGSGKGNNGNTKQRRIRVRTTKEVADTLFRGYDKARNHSVFMPSPIQCPEIYLPIAPYTLGAWLGDGHNADARITCADEEIMENIANDGFLLGKRTFYKKGKAWSQAIGIRERGVCYRGHSQSRVKANGRCLDCEKEMDHFKRNGTEPSPIIKFTLAHKLQKAGLLNNKHIPGKYFRASLNQRLSLLQGLMDTDGSINKNGRVLTFTGINETLVRGVSELLSTFGIKNTVIERPVTCNGKPAGVAYFVQFMAFRDVTPVFRLKRKLDRMRLSTEKGVNKNRSKTVQIVNAIKINSVPVKCITVDSPDHQFLFGKTMLPTHNSTGAAAIMMTALIRNWRDSAEFVIIAPTVEIAQNSFLPARDMVKADPELSELMHIQEHYRQITHRVTNATLKVVAADNETVGGKKATGILIDEAWIFGKRNNAENMLREACGGLASRPEGFIIWLSTQSDETPAGVFKQKLDYARGVRDGRIDDNKFLPVIYEFPKAILDEKKHLDPKMFYVTNPNLGASVDEEFIIREFKKAENDGQESMQGFLSKHLNVEIGVSLKSQRWVGADYWEGAKGIVTLDYILGNSEVIVIGIDGGGLDDLLGLAVIGREMVTGNWLLWNKIWIHPIALERRKSEHEKYMDFVKDGDLIIVDEIGKDLKQLAEIVRKCLPLLFKIGVDRYGIGSIVDELEAGDGNEENAIPHDMIGAVSQGWQLNGAIKTTERKLAEKTLIHAGQPIMNWCAGNARVELKGNAVAITKQNAGTGKIDPLMATFDAVTLMAMNPEAKLKQSGYENPAKEIITL